MTTSEEKIKLLDRAFLSTEGIHVFSSWVQANEIWKQDPYDVETIHDEARRVFSDIVENTLTTGNPHYDGGGKTLLLLGESGAGKTHLMRSFRNYMHSNNYGYFGYMQMTAPSENYERYILSNFINSLDQPYYSPIYNETCLSRILNGLAEHPALAEKKVRLKDGKRRRILDVLKRVNFTQEKLDRMIQNIVSSFLKDSQIEQIISDPDILTALLYLQVDNPLIKKTVMKYLRGEDLSSLQRQYIGGLTPRTNNEDAQVLFRELVKTIWATQKKIVVVCLDQWETMSNFTNWEDHVKRSSDAMAFMHDGLSHCIFVLSCLEDHYEQYHRLLSSPTLVRLEKNCPKQTLKESLQSPDDACAVVANRLRSLYDYHGVSPLEDRPTYPFPEEKIHQFNGTSIRKLILACNDYRTEARRLRCLPNSFPLKPVQETPGPVIDSDPPDTLEEKWNAFKSSFASGDVPDREENLAKLLAKILPHAALEFQKHDRMDAVPVGHYVQIQNWTEPVLIGICNHKAGAKLNAFLEEFYQNKKKQRLVIARTVPFATTPTAKSNEIINQQCKYGHRKAKIEDTDLRFWLAFLEFEKQEGRRCDFTQWRKRFRPLTQLECLQRILDIDDSFYEPNETQPFVISSDDEVKSVSNDKDKTIAPVTNTHGLNETENDRSICIGKTEGIQPEPVLLSADDFVTHATFLGSSGSGKTVAAMNIVEELLLKGIPAILVDRKGDLCSYASPDAWNKPKDREEERRIDQIRSSIDVRLYTPGENEGNPLSIPLIPPGADLSKNTEREKIAKQTASAICDMMNYGSKGNDEKKRAVLIKAIETLMYFSPTAQLNLQSAIDLIHEEDSHLMGAIGHLNRKLLPRLVDDLQTLLIHFEYLLESGQNPLDIDELLGKGVHQIPGKTRLSIISAKFLRGNPEILFWVAQFLCAIEQWLNRHSQDRLQAVLLFDEADLYLPANRQPATKAPLENLLRRARSSGLGLFLATQNPGDMDYKCREQIKTWFLGRITGDTSLKKIKPMTERCPGDILSRLPAQEAGQFHVIRPEFEGGVKRIKSRMPLVSIDQYSEEKILALAKEGRSG